MKLNFYSISRDKALLFVFSILLIACTKTILLEKVPQESAGNPTRGEGANVARSTVLDLSSTETIDLNEEKLREDTLEVDHHANSKITKEKNEDSSTSTSILYECPMHPEVTSKNPKDICPKCNMLINKEVKADQTKLEKMAEHSSHQNMHHGETKE